MCVLSQTETKPAWDSFLKPPNFTPFQNATMQLKKLMPCKKRVTNDHVVNVCGAGLTLTQRTEKMDEINEESRAAVEWGREQVKQKMMFAAARVGLKVGNRNAKKFGDIKESLREDNSNANIARIYEICYGDYEGEAAQGWSTDLEKKHMREKRLQCEIDPKNPRDKGGIEMCITKAKVDTVAKIWGSSTGGTCLVLSLKGEKGLTPKMIADKKREKVLIERKEAKSHRRQNGEFYLKIKVRKRGRSKVICAPLCVCLTTCCRRHAGAGNMEDAMPGSGNTAFKAGHCY